MSLLHLNHLVIVAIGIYLLIEVREQLRPIARHKADTTNLALLECLIRK